MMKYIPPIRSVSMQFGICSRDAMGRYNVLACALTLDLAQHLASAMANDLDLFKYDSPKHRPILYVVDMKGLLYGSY